MAAAVAAAAAATTTAQRERCMAAAAMAAQYERQALCAQGRQAGVLGKAAAGGSGGACLGQCAAREKGSLEGQREDQDGLIWVYLLRSAPHAIDPYGGRVWWYGTGTVRYRPGAPGGPVGHVDGVEAGQSYCRGSVYSI